VRDQYPLTSQVKFPASLVLPVPLPTARCAHRLLQVRRLPVRACHVGNLDPISASESGPITRGPNVETDGRGGATIIVPGENGAYPVNSNSS